MPIYLAMLRTPLLLLLVVGLLAGCRTYGGYGSEEASIDEMAEAVESYGDLLAQARVVALRLERAAERDPSLRPVVARFDAVMTGHAVLLEDHEEALAELVGSDDYRRISRVFGAAVAEHELTARQYREVVRYAAQVPDTLAELVYAEVAPLGRYYVVPPFYERARRSRLGPFSDLETGPDTEMQRPPADTGR